MKTVCALFAGLFIWLFTLGFSNTSFAKSDVIRLPHNIEIRKITDNAYTATDVDYHESTVLIVKTQDETVVIASSPFEGVGTQAMMDWIKKDLKPKKMVTVNTHFHLDGSGGNEVYEKNGVEIWSSDLTQKFQKEKLKGTLKGAARGFKGDLEKRILNTQVVPAKHTFPAKEGKTFDFSGEKVEVFFPGEAHSLDNVVVYFPKQKVLFGGCMIKPEVIGYLGDANVKAWPESAKRLKKFDVKYVVQGHGPVGGPEFLDKTIQVAEAAAKAAKP